jgi:hypothetical protein
MEYASVLAGEKFSDHPRCTHPVLASIARMVNDNCSDPGRQQLLPLVPDVIGTRSRDARIGPTLAIAAAGVLAEVAPGTARQLRESADRALADTRWQRLILRCQHARWAPCIADAMLAARVRDDATWRRLLAKCIAAYWAGPWARADAASWVHPGAVHGSLEH